MSDSYQFKITDVLSQLTLQHGSEEGLHLVVYEVTWEDSPDEDVKVQRYLFLSEECAKGIAVHENHPHVGKVTPIPLYIDTN